MEEVLSETHADSIYRGPGLVWVIVEVPWESATEVRAERRSGINQIQRGELQEAIQARELGDDGNDFPDRQNIKLIGLYYFIQRVYYT